MLNDKYQDLDTLRAEMYFETLETFHHIGSFEKYPDEHCAKLSIKSELTVNDYFEVDVITGEIECFGFIETFLKKKPDTYVRDAQFPIPNDRVSLYLQTSRVFCAGYTDEMLFASPLIYFDARNKDGASYVLG